MRDQGKETSPWVWIGTGCGGCIVLLVLVVVGAGYFGFRALTGFRDALIDPEIRTERVLEILGASELPEGYRAQMFLSIPFTAELAVIGDGEEPDFSDGRSFDQSFLSGDSIGGHFLVYVRFRRMELDDDDLRHIVLGEENASDVQIQLGYRFLAEEEVDAGSFEIEGGRVDFRILRGALSSRGDDQSGVMAAMAIRCDDARGSGAARGSRAAGWFERDALLPATMRNEEVGEFVGRFGFCSGD